jgi:hypothetical protein
LALAVSRLEQQSRLSSVEQSTTVLTHSRGDNFVAIKTAIFPDVFRMP